MIVVDTDILIDVERKYPPAIGWFYSLDEVPGVACFSVMELIQTTESKKDLAAVDQLVKPLAILYPSAGELKLAIAWFRQFHLSHGLGLVDALIAAVAQGKTLATLNTRHFRAIPDLSLVAPYRKSRP